MNQTTALSENAVAVLRFRMKGLRVPVTDQRRPAFRELAAAGLMEPVAAGENPEADYRFTDVDPARREEILRTEEDRIERERYEPPDASNLSDAARERLRRHLEGDRKVTDQNRPAYRELAAARIMIPLHTFVGGDESAYRFTYWGWEGRFEFAQMSCGEEVA